MVVSPQAPPPAPGFPRDSGLALDIWWISGSPYAWWVLLAAEAKGLGYESHMLSKTRRENRTPEYLAINPRGRVPLIRDGDFFLSESMAIVAYLDSKSAATPLFGANPRDAARVWEAVSQVLSDLQRDVFADAILSGRAKADDPAPIRESAAKLKTALGFFEKRLASAPYLCGDTLSAADIALLPFCSSICVPPAGTSHGPSISRSCLWPTTTRDWLPLPSASKAFPDTTGRIRPIGATEVAIRCRTLAPGHERSEARSAGRSGRIAACPVGS